MSDRAEAIRTIRSAPAVRPLCRGPSFIPPIVAGLALAVVLGPIVPHVSSGPGLNEVLIFAAGAAAAVLVLRLIVQRERRVALQLVVSEIVGENTSPEIAAMRILEALCCLPGLGCGPAAGKSTLEENRLEFCSAWGAPGRRTETLIQESMGLKLSSGDDLPGKAWQDGRAMWVADLASMPSANLHTQTAQRHGMVSGCAVPVRVGNKVLAVLEFYCHFCLRENREAMAAVETVAASLGQMLARSQRARPRRKALSPAGDSAQLRRRRHLRPRSATAWSALPTRPPRACWAPTRRA